MLCLFISLIFIKGLNWKWFKTSKSDTKKLGVMLRARKRKSNNI